MADQKISQLADGNPAQGNDLLIVSRGASNYKVNVSTITSSIGAQGSDKQIQYNNNKYISKIIRNDKDIIYEEFGKLMDFNFNIMDPTQKYILYPLELCNIEDIDEKNDNYLKLNQKTMFKQSIKDGSTPYKVKNSNLKLSKKWQELDDFIDDANCENCITSFPPKQAFKRDFDKLLLERSGRKLTMTRKKT